MNKPSNNTKYLIVIAGPTAVGKTSLSISLATHFSSEILSADSRQIYKEMSIGTAKPTRQEVNIVKHHFIDHISITNPYSAGNFEKEALSRIELIHKISDYALLVGGSGLYLKAVIDGIDYFPPVSDKVVQILQNELEEYGLSPLVNELKQRDIESYKVLDLKNSRRVIRALGIIRSSGKTFSSFKNTIKPKRPFHIIPILLQRPKEELHERIHLRVDQMIQNGLIEEVKSLIPYRHLRSLQTVGYQEVFQYHDESISLDEAVNLIKTKTRQYAKRQQTYFKKYTPWSIFHPDDRDAILRYIDKQSSV